MFYICCFFYWKIIFRGHVEDVYDLAWSPDSNQLITGSVDNSAIIWDANKGKHNYIGLNYREFSTCENLALSVLF